MRSRAVGVGAASLVLLAACYLSAASAQTPPPSLGGTSWQLVRIQSMDDKVVTPDDRSKYTIAFGTDGRVNMRIDCNRGGGTWKSAEANQLVLGPMAVTRAMCPPGSLHDRVLKDMEFVRSYTIKDSHLFLSLVADGGIYEFEPLPKAGGGQAKADGPSYDCSKASGTVEKLICGDAALGKLDRQLASVYAASAKRPARPFRDGSRPSSPADVLGASGRGKGHLDGCGAHLQAAEVMLVVAASLLT